MPTDRRTLMLGAGALSLAAPNLMGGAASAQHNRLLTHRFGVNYVPSQNWYFVWNDWKPDDIARDFDAIEQVGADHIRIMLVWPWFQPNQRFVSPAHLDRLDAMMRLAALRGLDVLVTVFTGWLSGFAFKPPYLETEPLYESDKWATVQDRFLAEIGLRMAQHPNFLGFDIGNEINVAWQTTPTKGDLWMQRVFETMRRVAPGKIHVNGVDNQPWFREDTFSPQALMAQQEIVSLHSWSFWAGAGKYGGPLDPPYVLLPAALTALARAYGNAPQKPIWLQEFGACDIEMPAADVAIWMERAVEGAVAEGVSWFTWWCSHDVSRNLEFHPFEFDLGLMETDNTIKPRGQTFKRLADAYRNKPVKIPKTSLPPPPEVRNAEATWAWLLAWINARG